MKETVDQICSQLTERNHAAVKRVVAAVGVDQALALLTQALELEANGGMPTHDGQRRRTPGGVFFQLARAVVPKERHPQVFPAPYAVRKAKQRREQARQSKEGMGTGADERKERQDSTEQETITPASTSESEQRPPPKETAVKASAALPLTWEEAKVLIVHVIKTPGEGKTVKLTLIGRPLKVIAQKDCVVVSLKGREPKTLPTGLPHVPEGSAITWAVFIAHKQWVKVKDSMEQNQTDQLIIEGYPIVGKNGVAAVMANSCKSMLMERAQRESLKT